MPAFLEAVNRLIKEDPAVDILPHPIQTGNRVDRQLALVSFSGNKSEIDLGYPEKVTGRLRFLLWRDYLVGGVTLLSSLTPYVDGLNRVGNGLTTQNWAEAGVGSFEMGAGFVAAMATITLGSREINVINRIRGRWAEKIVERFSGVRSVSLDTEIVSQN